MQEKSAYRIFQEIHQSAHINILLSLNLLNILFSLISPLLTRSLIDEVFIAKNREC